MPIASLALAALMAAAALPLHPQEPQEEVDLVAQELAQRERVAWQAVLDRDIEALDRFLAEDFVFADSFFYGISKAETLEYLDGEPDEGVFEIRVRSYVVPNPDTQIFHYTLAGGSDDPPEDLTLRTSVWVRRGGRWVVVFHQEAEPWSFDSDGSG